MLGIRIVEKGIVVPPAAWKSPSLGKFICYLPENFGVIGLSKARTGSNTMKLKTTIAAFLFAALPFVSAQDEPAKEPAAEKAAEEIKPEGPLEVEAFKVVKLVMQMPDILASVKDEASLAAAETKMDGLGKKLEAQAAKLAKLPKPSNEDRKKLKAKMEKMTKPMQDKMQAAMQGMIQLDPALAEKTGAMFQKFGERMEKLSPTMDQYFKPDEEKEEGGKEE